MPTPVGQTSVNQMNSFKTQRATTQGSSAGKLKNKASYDALDRQAFLKLLVTELRNQDPLEPMKDREFIAQLAQFSTLEQMTSLNNRFDKFLKLNASSLMGKTVKTTSGEEGKVEAVFFRKEGITVLVNKKEYSLEEITEVK